MTETYDPRKNFAADLESMTDDQIKVEIDEVSERLHDDEGWLEALSAELRHRRGDRHPLQSDEGATDNAPDFKSGDVVQLKSGGQCMTLIFSAEEYGSICAQVCWFDEAKLVFEELPFDVLQKANDATPF